MRCRIAWCLFGCVELLGDTPRMGGFSSFEDGRAFETLRATVRDTVAASERAGAGSTDEREEAEKPRHVSGEGVARTPLAYFFRNRVWEKVG